LPQKKARKAWKCILAAAREYGITDEKQQILWALRMIPQEQELPWQLRLIQRMTRRK